MSLPGPSRHNHRMLEERWGDRVKEDPDELDLQVERRREIYHYELYVKVCRHFHPPQLGFTLTSPSI